MKHVFTHDFDEQRYLRDHPEVAGLVSRGEVASAYQHFIAADIDHDSYRLTAPPPTVSIVVPCYQAEQYLEYTLASIRAQTYQAWECIAVEDFSRDATLAIIKRFLAKDKRFKVVPHRANGGLSAARNSGIRSARGKYICFLDSDDLMMPGSVENRVRLMESAASERLGGCYSASITIDEACERPPREQPATGMKLVDFITAAGMCPFNANQPMFRTGVLRLLGGFDERLKQAEDWDLWMRVLRHGYYLVPTNIADVTYRARAASMVRSDPLRHLETALRLHEAVHHGFPEGKIFEGTPFVYRKPWIAYKRQLDIAGRVLEFSGMAMSRGQINGRAVEVSAKALPDFFGAIESHRDVNKSVQSGIRRQMVGATDSAVAYASQGVVNSYIASWRGADNGAEAPSTAGFPESVGPDAGLQRAADIAFLPHKDYHVWSFALILDALQEAGISYTFVDLTVIYRDEGARRKLDELGLPRVSYNELLLGNCRPKMVVCMNDWDPIVRGIVQCCQTLGIPTVGVVEGVQDYLDADTGRVRAPYRTVDWVLLPGEFDRRYFADSPNVRVGGVPRVDELLRENNAFPAKPLVVINSNFTYNVLTEHRDHWVRSIVDACAELGYDYIISRHPADQGDFSAYKVADESMYDLIRRGSVFVSRFGSGILEALAMGKPSVYFNPHREKVDKFTEPNGAFPISFSKAELVEHLRATVEAPEQFLEHAADYVEHHCGARRGGESATKRLAAAMIDIFRSASIPDDDKRARLKLLLMEQDEALLGPRTLDRTQPLRGAPGRAPAAASAIRSRLSDLNDQSYEERLRRVRRKYRKLRRDPKAFFADSRYSVLNALERFF